MTRPFCVPIVAPLVATICHFGVFSLFARTAYADTGVAMTTPSPADDREARALEKFQRGREWMAQKRYEEARREFEESEKLDPEVGTLLNLGYCYEKLGKTASAWATYREAAAAAQEQGRLAWENAARERVARLEGSLLRVVIQVQAQASGDTLNVWVDGTPLPRSAWGQAAPLYPGQHEVRAKATDRRMWTVSFELNAEHVPTVMVPALEPEAIPRPGLSPRARNARRTAAMVLGGTGVAALGVMAGFGWTAIATYRGADCSAGVCADRAAQATQIRAFNEASVSNVAAALGGGALVGAAILWFATPSFREGVELQAALDGATWGASLRGVW